MKEDNIIVTNQTTSKEIDLWPDPYPCDTCGDYEYCAGRWGTDECTGWIQAATIIPGIGPVCDDNEYYES